MIKLGHGRRGSTGIVPPALGCRVACPGPMAHMPRMRARWRAHTRTCPRGSAQDEPNTFPVHSCIWDPMSSKLCRETVAPIRYSPVRLHRRSPPNVKREITRTWTQNAFTLHVSRPEAELTRSRVHPRRGRNEQRVLGFHHTVTRRPSRDQS